jgi:hypothetical protein
MKNEREHVKPSSRDNGVCFKQRDKARQQIIEQQQNANISISWPQKKIEKQREKYMWEYAEFPLHHKKKEAKEKKWNWKN